jgi:tetratricopeptide (TPR) repeat protein
MLAAEASIARDSLTTAVSLHEKAIALRQASDLRRAETACRRAVALYGESEGHDHPDVANALVELGQILEARDRLTEARDCYARALAIVTPEPRKKGADPDLLRLHVRAQTLLAGAHRALGDYKRADVSYRRALAAARKFFGPRDPDVGGLLNNLGVLRKYQGRFDEAADYYRQALALIKRGDDPEATATLYHNLGGLEHSRGRFARGIPHARRSVAMRQAVLGAHHPRVAADVAALAALLDGDGALEEAASLYQRALRIFRRRLGNKSGEVAINLSNLAALRHGQRRPREAEALYRQSLALQEAIFGRGHPEVGMTLNNLAVLMREKGDATAAAALYRRAVSIFEKVLGPRHPHTVTSRANYQDLVSARNLRGATKARAANYR